MKKKFKKQTHKKKTKSKTAADEILVIACMVSVDVRPGTGLRRVASERASS